ncbi:MAG: hypothetical protein CVV48_00535 [Spirochaetae bacterium HGW-Spirochaetae-4]|jgi:hypothetical protein|nr:MAG: hypothetical protein A2Y31_01650 [Spirochaetes bacterium GWC2_52_13]PKL22915.1 MAG: hypothetical protein CVV48_00535 [Spirochaetae bacterium HGW-Spirochaetae-4]HCG63680.1 hypothetical protein [Sphaerochaeta sp.]HCS35106.1 hypothetical protein [Sphaerochaeta sp.]
MKKKLIISLLVLLLVGSSLFAYTFPDFYYPLTSFRPISARTEAMGGAGLSTASGADAFFMNPANLASRRFSLYLPAVSVTVFNPKAIIDSGIIEDIQENEDPDTLATTVVNKYMGIVSAGRGEVVTTDVAMSFTGGGFGIGMQVQEQLHTYSTDGQLTSDKIIAEINAAASVGFGFRLDFIPEILSVDVGATARPTYKAYSNKIGANEIINIADDDDPAQKFMSEYPVAAGWAVPVDVGVNVNLPVGLRVSAVARNLNGKYTMTQYDVSGDWVNEMMEFMGSDPAYTGTPGTTTEYEYTVPWTLDFGFGWIPELGGLGRLLRPSFAFDLVDVVTLAESMETDEDAYLNHLRFGAEAKLFSMVDVRAGINQGYLSLGVGLDLFVIHIDASYYWREYGAEIGDKPIDALTVRFNLGVDGR